MFLISDGSSFWKFLKVEGCFRLRLSIVKAWQTNYKAFKAIRGLKMNRILDFAPENQQKRGEGQKFHKFVQIGLI